MSTINPSLQIGGVNGWKGKEGAVLGWQETSGGLFKPAKFDFTRLSGSASYVDENGLIQIEHRPNYPRFTWKNGKQCLMNEEARTNNILQSNNFSLSWNTGNGVSTPTIEAGEEIISGKNVYRITEDGTTGIHRIFQASSISAGQGVITYFIGKYVDRQWLSIRSAVSGVDKYANFDIQNGVLGNVESGLTAGIEALNNGYYLCWAYSSDSDANHLHLIYSKDGDGIGSGNTIFAGSSSFLLAHAQLEIGSYYSSPIPTEGSAVTRAAESIEGLNLGNFLGDSQGGLYVDGLFFNTSPQAIGINGGAAAESVLLEVGAASSARFRVLNSGTQCDISGGSISANTFYKMFGAYATNDFAFYFDGTQIGTDSSGSTFSDGTLTQLETQSGSGSLFSRGLIHEIRAYDQRPANTQMETETL